MDDTGGGCPLMTKSEQLTKNNNWFAFDDSCETVIVMVHGYFSDSEKCWMSANGVFWPKLIVSDARTTGIPIFLGGYHTSMNSGTYGVQECSEELLRALRRESALGQPGPISKRNIVFVCHSMGGIVVRHMLERSSAIFHGKNIGLCLYASPSLGSGYADLAGLVSWFLRNRAGAQLKYMSEYLSDLDDRFSRYLENTRESFLGAEATEHLGPKFGWIRLPKPIVGKESSARYFSRRQVLPETDHSSIVKPQSLVCAGHNFLVDYLREFQERFGAVQRISVAISGQEVTTTVRPTSHLSALFSAYEAEHEEFYLERAADKVLRQKLDCACLWVYGESGVGKTCAIKRNLMQAGFQCLHVCLSQCGVNPSREDLIRELIETCAMVCGINVEEHSYHCLVKMLVEHGKGDLLIYIDEVSTGPCCEAGPNELLKLCVDLSITLTQRQARRVKFVVSSLFKPELELDRVGKINEIFLFLGLSPWDTGELKGLIQVIEGALPGLRLADDDIECLVEAATGSPRFIKTFFKNMNWYPIGGQVFHQILSDTRDSIAA